MVLRARVSQVIKADKAVRRAQVERAERAAMGAAFWC
jgi:hypothetical protein